MSDQLEVCLVNSDMKIFRKILVVLSVFLIVYGILVSLLSGINTIFNFFRFVLGSDRQSNSVKPELLHGLFETTYGLVTIAIYVGLFLYFFKNQKFFLKISAYGFAMAFLIDLVLLILPRGIVERTSSLSHTEFVTDLAEFMKVIPYGILNALLATAILFLVHEERPGFPKSS